jgi:hypothetical protein
MWPETSPSGHRGANGNIKPPSAAERRRSQRQLEDNEKAVVLAQPHRRGDLSQNRESPLGRLAAKWKLRSEIIDAGFQYGRKVRLWQVNHGVQIEVHAPSAGHSGAEIDAATMRRWNAEIIRIDKALKEISLVGFNAVRMLTAAEREIAPGVEEAAVACLTELAIQLSMLRRVTPRG